MVLTVTVSESQPVTYSTLNKKRSELRGRGEVRVGFETRRAITFVVVKQTRPFLAHWKGLEELYKVVVTDHQLVVNSTS